MNKAPQIPVKCISCKCDHGYMNRQTSKPNPYSTICYHVGFFMRYKKCTEYNETWKIVYDEFHKEKKRRHSFWLEEVAKLLRITGFSMMFVGIGFMFQFGIRELITVGIGLAILGISFIIRGKKVTS